MQASKILLICWLIVAITAVCPANTDLANIEVGSAYFSTTSSSQQITNALYEHTFTKVFPAQPMVAYSIHSIGLATGIVSEWAISTQNVTPNSLKVKFKHKDSEWTMIKAGFWATTRSDIFLGSLNASKNLDYKDFASLKQTTTIVTATFPASSSIANPSAYIMRTFMSGFTMKSGNQIFLRTFDKAIYTNKVQIGVQVGGAMEIKQIQVNYIVFSPQSSVFASYGGGVNELNFVQSKLYNIQKIIHSSVYRFHGIANIRQPLSSVSSPSPLFLISQISPNFYLSMDTTSSIQQVYLSYLVIGVTGAKVCSACGTQNIINDAGQCISDCSSSSSDQYLVNYKDGKGCRKCNTDYGMVVNNNNSGCVCRAGYTDRKGYCVDSDGKPFKHDDFANNFAPATGFSQGGWASPPQSTVQQQQQQSTNNKIVPQSLTTTNNKIIPQSFVISNSQSKNIVSTSTTIRNTQPDIMEASTIKTGSVNNVNNIITTVTPIEPLISNSASLSTQSYKPTIPVSSSTVATTVNKNDIAATTGSDGNQIQTNYSKQTNNMLSTINAINSIMNKEQAKVALLRNQTKLPQTFNYGSNLGDAVPIVPPSPPVSSASTLIKVISNTLPTSPQNTAITSYTPPSSMPAQQQSVIKQTIQPQYGVPPSIPVAPVPVPITSPVAVYSIQNNIQQATSQDVNYYQQPNAPVVQSNQQSYLPVVSNQQQSYNPIIPSQQEVKNQYNNNQNNQIQSSAISNTANSYVPDIVPQSAPVSRPSSSQIVNVNPMIGQSISNSYVAQVPANPQMPSYPSSQVPSSYPIPQTSPPSYPTRQIAPSYPQSYTPSYPPSVSAQAQSYIPLLPPNRPLQPATPTPTPPTKPYVVDCSLIPNTYWSGFKCVCKVGYITINDKCVQNRLQVTNLNLFIRPTQFITKGSTIDNHHYHNGRDSCLQDNQIYDYAEDKCVCISGCVRSDTGKCITKQNYDDRSKNNGSYTAPYPSPKPYPPGPSSSSSENPQYPKPYRPPQQYPQYPNNPSQYPPPAVISIPPVVVRCGANSAPDEMNKCRCLPGCYSNKSSSSLQCLRCPAGQFYVPITDTCIHLCGVNQRYNNITNKCQCDTGYGLGQQRTCRICQISKQEFVKFGYCLTCPLNMLYDPMQDKCVCSYDYTYRNGTCTQKCLTNQIFSQQTNRCLCVPGFTQVNNKCILCDSSIRAPQCQQSTPIKCPPGFGISIDKTCIQCQSVPNSFLKDGYCVMCPFNTQLIAGTCQCSLNKKLQDGKCIDQCQPGQLADNNGFCYVCPINQQPANGICQCKTGFTRVAGRCKLKCQGFNAIQSNGICMFCALNTEYDQQKRACVCSKGYYINAYGVCEQYIPPVVSCGQGQFYSKQSNRCELCPPGCKYCQSANSCSQCISDGFYPPRCAPRCGDGIQVDPQACDDGNSNNNDGCSNSCQVEPNFICNGRKPTTCIRVAVQPPVPQNSYCGDSVVGGNQQCDDGNMFRGDGCWNCFVQSGWICPRNICVRSSMMSPPNGPNPPIVTPPIAPPSSGQNLKLVGDVFINQNNVFATLQTPIAFQFASDYEKKSFIKYEFQDPSTQPSSAYCSQRATNLKQFECLMIYASGVPNKIFSIKFSYNNNNGQTGQLTMNVNPFTSILRTRSLK